MTADPSEEPGRPKRRRRRRRRPARGGDPRVDAARDDADAPDSGSSDEPQRTDDGDRTDVPGRSRRRRRRRRRRRSGADPTTGTPAQPPAADAASPATSSAEARRRDGKASASRRRRRRSSSGTVVPSRSRRTLTTTKEVSAGGVVYRRTDDGALEVLLASRRTRRGDLAWGLAKGGIEDGETNEDAAIREVREETGIVAEIEDSLGATRYIYVWEDVRIRKTVHFFLMRAIGGDPDDHDDEMEEIRWFPMERALKRAAYRGEREVLGRAADLLRS